MSPFDKARYTRLLEGLEVSEVKFSYVLKNDEIFRIDSNYFQKQYLAEESIIRIRHARSLRDIGAQIRSFGAYSLNNEVTYLDAGIPFIRGVNMKDGRVNFGDMLYISPDVHALLWKSEVTKGMVLLSMSGTIGDVAIATKQWKYPVNSNQDIAKIDTNGSLNPYILYAFLLSKFGQNYLKRQARGSVQQHVFLSQIEKFEIPVFTSEFEKVIQLTLEKSEARQVEAEVCLARAEKILEKTLGLESWQQPEALSYIRSSREVFVTERLDAEHFKPRITALLELLNATGQAQPLSEVLAFKQRGQQPTYRENGLPVINSKHVNRGEVRLNDDNRVATFDEKTPLIQPGDVLMNGTGVGTIGRSAPYLHQTPAIPDNHVTILRPKPGIDPVYLSVFLNSIAGQIQVEQWQRGSSGQIELYPDDIARFLVWVAPTSTQHSIKQAIESSFQEKQRSTMLLDAACRAVEIAIENSEAAAMDYLETQG